MDLRTIVAKSSPLLAAALSSVNPLAGLIFTGIAHLFGLNTDATQDQVVNAIANDPDHDIKLKNLEYQHQEALRSIEVQMRQGAYQREQLITSATGKRDVVMEIIALCMVFGFFLMCFIVTFVPITKISSDLMYLVIGQFSTGFITVLSYYFGATKAHSSVQVPISHLREVVLPPPEETRRG